MVSTTGPQLLGRRTERAALDDMVAAARRGRSGAVVLRGEAGIGKTALLRHVVGSATGCEVLRASGVESEMELPFAGLQQLCAPLLDRLGELPGPQRDALRTAFGLAEGDPPDRFLVGLAVLTLLAGAAADRPVVCVVDDAQWLDRVSAQTLAFVARRLAAESVALVFALRVPTSMRLLEGIAELEVRGLPDADAHALLAAGLRGPLDRQVRDRIVAETHGNPLALLELPQGRSAVELAFGFQSPDLMPMASRIEQDYQRRLEQLPPETAQLLLTSAVEPVGDPALLRRAAALLGIAVDAGPARAAGLVEPTEGVRFRHPLVRSAVYRSATAGQRRAAHRALADATDAATDPDRRAWHRAQACAGPDETVAGELEASADRASRRGGISAAAALLEQAAVLSPDPHRRGARALAAAEGEHAAGAPEAAAELVAMARLCPLDEGQRARLARLEAQMEFARTRGGAAAHLLLRAAQGLEPVDAELARETYLEAMGASIVGAAVDGPDGVRAVAAAARAGTAVVAQGVLPADRLLDGVATWLTEGDGTFAALREAFHGYASAPLTDRRATMAWLRSYFVALQVGNHQLWDLDAWEALATRAVGLARELGALSALPIGLVSLAGARLYAGDLRAADHLVEEGDALAAATRSAPIRYTALNLAAWRGDEETVTALLEQTVPDATERGETYVLGLAGYVTAVLHNGRGRYDLAAAAARRVAAHDGFSFRGWALAELVEAAVRTGDLDEARAARSALDERTRASGSDWALGVQACCDALIAGADGDAAAERLHRDAIERLRRSHVVVQQARAHLLYGEWLRRQGRRRDARAQLHAAHELAGDLGLAAFADRAGRELRATGETVRGRVAGHDGRLTAQESQIARLAAGGMTNPEIGAHLFLSPHTVEWHLRKVFTKLGISSRRQLAGVLPRAAAQEPS
jgi:DNA-binding CsgD family transcriptional regulator